MTRSTSNGLSRRVHPPRVPKITPPRQVARQYHQLSRHPTQVVAPHLFRAVSTALPPSPSSTSSAAASSTLSTVASVTPAAPGKADEKLSADPGGNHVDMAFSGDLADLSGPPGLLPGRPTESLLHELNRFIRVRGAMPLSHFMTHALTHPRHGYYMKGDVFGTKGDFTTAPEVSQMFGELLCVWCVAMWRDLGSPASVALVEMGPGRGTLMKDMLRAAAQFPEFAGALCMCCGSHQSSCIGWPRVGQQTRQRQRRQQRRNGSGSSTGDGMDGGVQVG